VVFARSARKELQTLDRRVAARILKRVEALTREPRPPGCTKLEGTDRLWRIRIGDWRVVYSIDDISSLLEVLVIRHRRDVYR
jgi:mRNA interferase RelE/StbE